MFVDHLADSFEIIYTGDSLLSIIYSIPNTSKVCIIKPMPNAIDLYQAMCQDISLSSINHLIYQSYTHSLLVVNYQELLPSFHFISLSSLIQQHQYSIIHPDNIQANLMNGYMKRVINLYDDLHDLSTTSSSIPLEYIFNSFNKQDQIAKKKFLNHDLDQLLNKDLSSFMPNIIGLSEILKQKAQEEAQEEDQEKQTTATKRRRRSDSKRRKE